MLDVSGPAAVPRKNGELVFETPWESRAFGIAVALSERGAFDWEEFRKELISEIKETEKGEFARTGKWSYYDIWTASLEKLLIAKGIITREEMKEGVTQVEASWEHDEATHHHNES